jgi:hypothetical protein
VAARRVNLNLAGQTFGFDLPAFQAEDRAEETQSVLSQYFPELKLTFGSKTQRGGRLGRSSTTMTPEVFLKQKEAAAAGAAAPISINFQQPAAAPTPTPIPTPTRKPISAKAGQSELYFGHEDYWRNLEAGYTPEEIKSYITENQQLLNPASKNIKGGGGLYDQIMAGRVDVITGAPTSSSTASKPAPAPTPTPTPSYAISSQLNIPREQAGFVSAPTPSPSASAREPISAKWGLSDQYFGGEDVRAAEAAGYSAQEIFDYIDRARQTNPNILQGGNVPGVAGGVYETVRKAAGR